MAEFILKKKVAEKGLQDSFRIASAATSSEEIWGGRGNPVYPPAKKELKKHGISCEGKRAVQMTKTDYDRYDYIIAMEHWNVRNILRIVGNDPQRKISLLLDYSENPRDISDPWYTGDFDTAYSDIEEGCDAFLNFLIRNGRV